MLFARVTISELIAQGGSMRGKEMCAGVLENIRME